MWASSDRCRFARRGLRWVLIALFCALFAFVYEQFSHGVWSAAMVFAFAYPLLCALPFLICAAAGREIGYVSSAAGLWQAGMAAFTVGSLMRGALEIYGTTHRLTIVYPIVGGLLCIAAAAVWSVRRNRR